MPNSIDEPDYSSGSAHADRSGESRLRAAASTGQRFSESEVECPDWGLAQLFERQVRAAPTAVALVDGDHTSTYAALNARANQLARYLRGVGIKLETVAGVLLRRPADLLVATLAVIKAGGAYLPLDPDQPAERLEYMLADAGARVLVTDSQKCGSHTASRAQVLCLDQLVATLDCMPTDDFTTAAGPENLAYVMYTSGSTGQPKGVLVEQRSVSRLVLGADYLQVASTDVVAWASNPAFDAATFEIWGALLNGAQLAPISKPTLLSPADLRDAIVRQRISVLFLTTAVFHQMARDDPAAFRGLRCLLFGGETADPRWVAAVLPHLPPGRLVHVYGPTESTTFATWHEVQSVSASQPRVPIGRPLRHARVYVLDPAGRPVPSGATGEIFIGGPGLARGYLNRPELNAERFVERDCGEAGTERLYRTGDLGQWLADGNLDFLGRSDEQVKLRGFRVELGEIEKVLERHGDVQQAVVAARGRSDGNVQLAAYLVPRRGCLISLSALRAHASQLLPDYMVPSAWMILESLPLSPNGKVDRRALPPPDGSRPPLSTPYLVPETPLERRLAELWARLLELRDVGRDDDFFELGGHSLLAARLFTTIEQEFGKKLPLSTLFAGATVRRLARILSADEPASAQGSLVEMQPNGSQPPLFLCYAIGGELLHWHRLVQCLGTDIPTFGFRPREVGGRPVAHDRLEDVAADCVAQLLAAGFHGPYRLAGFSFGGLVAFEMARQLRQRGQDVALLAVIDIGPEMHAPRSLTQWLLALPSCLTNLPRWIAGAVANWKDFPWRRKMRHRLWSLHDTLLGRRDASILPPLEDLFDVDRLAERSRLLLPGHFTAVSRFHPGPYDGSVLLLRARTRTLFHCRSHDLGWGACATGGVEVMNIPGDHSTVLSDPGVKRLAEILREKLAAAQPDRRSLEPLVHRADL